MFIGQCKQTTVWLIPRSILCGVRSKCVCEFIKRMIPISDVPHRSIPHRQYLKQVGVEVCGRQPADGGVGERSASGYR